MNVYLSGGVLMDTATGQPVDGVCEYTVSGGPNKATRAHIIYIDGVQKIVDFAPPEHLRPDTRLVSIVYDEIDSPQSQDRTMKMVGRFYRVGHDGALQDDAIGVASQQRISQADLLVSRDQKGLLHGTRSLVAAKFGEAVLAKILEDGEPVEKSECPDCRGTGKYHGLMHVEDCKRCNGTGKVK